jgi:hypothetical protein
MPDRGKPSTAYPGAVVGQIYVVNPQSTPRYYAVGPRTLMEISELQANILFADPATKLAYGNARPHPLPLTEAALAAAARQAMDPRGDDTPPARLPKIVGNERADAAVCVVVRDAASTPDVVLAPVPPRSDGAVATSRQTVDGTALADRIWVDPGHATLVEVMASPEATRGTLYLLTDLGVRHAVSSPDVLEALGYSGVRPVPMPASMAVRVPEGPALDPQAARKPVSLSEK